MGGGDDLGEGKMFLDRITILFHRFNNTNLTCQYSSILVYVDILHIVNIDVL